MDLIYQSEHFIILYVYGNIAYMNINAMPAEDSIGFPVTGVVDGCYSPCGCLYVNPGHKNSRSHLSRPQPERLKANLFELVTEIRF